MVKPAPSVAECQMGNAFLLTFVFSSETIGEGGGLQKSAALFRLRYETGRKSFSVCAPILISRGDMRGIKGLTSFTNDSIRCINVDLRVVADLYSFSLCFLFPFRKCRSGRRIGKGLIVRAIARNTKVLATATSKVVQQYGGFFGHARFDSCISGIRYSSHSNVAETSRM